MKHCFRNLAIAFVIVAFLSTIETALGFYDPAEQRWLNRDPLGEAGGINLYLAFFNSPLMYVDRNGLDNMYQQPNRLNFLQLNNAAPNIVISLAPQMQQNFRASIPVLQAQGSPPAIIAPSYVQTVPTGKNLLSAQYGGDDPLVLYAMFTAGQIAQFAAAEVTGVGAFKLLSLEGRLCKVAEGTLAAGERAEIQAIANKYNTTIDVVGSRAAGEGNNVLTDLPVGHDPILNRSDIDFRIDANHLQVNDLINDLKGVGNGAGSASTKYNTATRATTPPFIRFTPDE